MTNNEKHRMIAEWCEPRPSYLPGPIYLPDDSPGRLSAGGHWVATRDGVWGPRYAYGTFTGCREFEETAQRRGLLNEYLRSLYGTVPANHAVQRSSDPVDYIAAMWMATPQQRMNAIVRVIEQEKDNA